MTALLHPTPLRERQKQSRQRTISEAALELIRERGFDAVTMSDVADAAGVARATVFNYFASKDSFLADYHRRMTDEILSSVDPERGPSGIANVELLVRRFCSWAEGEPKLARAIVQRVFVSSELAAQDQDDELDLHAWLYRALLHSRRTGELPADRDVEIASRIIVALLSAAALDWVASGARSSLWRLTAPQLHMFLNLLRIPCP